MNGLTGTELSVVRRLADSSGSIRPSSTQRYHTVESPEGDRLGHRVQLRVIRSLERKGFIFYADGRYWLTVAGRTALKISGDRNGSHP